MEIRNLRDCLGKFATGVIIAATSLDNKLDGMTINSFSSVSLDPPLVLFCVDNRSSNLAKFTKNEFFTLNILSEDQQDLATQFAMPDNDKKWLAEEYSWTNNGCPVFDNTLGYFECRKDRIIEAGDHHIIIGEVVGFENLDENKNPLLYFKSKFCRI